MEKENKKRKLINKLTHKYRLVILNDSTFQEVGYLKLSRLNTISVAGTLLLLLITITYLTIAYTPLRELIPGYPDAELRYSIIQNRVRLDSLELELLYRDQYFNNIAAIISGREPESFLNLDTTQVKGDYNIMQVNLSPADSLLRQEFESVRQQPLSSRPIQMINPQLQLEKIHFFTPARGLVTNSFNPLGSHFGIDIVAPPNEVVKATLDGTITMATWTIETGHVIQVQHEHNLISLYKHNAELLKKVGSRVKAGDAIAIVGNSGELTTGPHLHFELWHNGVALNPEDYIVF
jgi:murein DD-endopeptidase MepM/ murein hydrolase activator NlpD